MSKDGDTAILDKWSRTELALKSGVDLVIELPLIYSISSAENFAEGAIKILNSLKMDTTLSFGSECGDLITLKEIAEVLLHEPEEYKTLLEHSLNKGISFPKARENALLMYLNNVRKYANVLKGSNNILAIEYLKALGKLKSSIEPLTIARINADYNSIVLDGNIASATAIRNGLLENKDIKNFLPNYSYELLLKKINNGQSILSFEAFEKIILYKLRLMSVEQIADLPTVSEGLEFKIKKAADSSSSLEELIDKIKSKRYTQSRINRILLYVLLDIKNKDIEDSYKAIPYIRVLGVNKKGKELLSKLTKNNKKLQIITSAKKFLEKNNNKILKNMLEKDMLASNIYTLGYNSNSKANLDYTNKLISLQ